MADRRYGNVFKLGTKKPLIPNSTIVQPSGPVQINVARAPQQIPQPKQEPQAATSMGNSNSNNAIPADILRLIAALEANNKNQKPILIEDGGNLDMGNININQKCQCNEEYQVPFNHNQDFTICPKCNNQNPFIKLIK